MTERSLEGLFERFRARGEAAALAEVFDRTAPELLRVAHHLAGDLGEAEDLLQATFVTAMERARTFDARRGLLPWLLGILANQARLARRRRERRPDPERLSKRAASDPARETERRELARALSTAIDELPAPYREVVAPHLVDGWRAVEIARELGRAPGTVRMQILRGLELLRRALPAGVVTGSALLRPGSRGLASVRATVLEKALAMGAPASAAIASQALIFGGLAVSMKLVMGIAGAVCALALAWIAWEPADSIDARAESSITAAQPSEAASSTALEPRRSSSAEALAPEANRTALASSSDPTSAAAAPGWWLVGEVRGLEADAAVGVNVGCRGIENAHAYARPSPTGSYAVDLGPLFSAARPGFYELDVTAFHPDYEEASAFVLIGPDDFDRAAAGRHELRCDLETRVYCGLTGLVELGDDAPAPNAWVMFVADDPGGRLMPVAVADVHCEKDGRFRLETTASGPGRLVAGADGCAPSMSSVEIPARGFLELPPIRLGRGAAEIRGRLELPPLFDARRVTVEARRSFDASAPPEKLFGPAFWSGERFELAEQRVAAESDGSFALGGLEPDASYLLSIGHIRGGVGILSHEPVLASAPAEGVQIGSQLGAVELEVVGGDPAAAGMSVALEYEGGWKGTPIAPSGRATFLVGRTADFRARIEKPGFEPAFIELPAAAREVDCRRRIVLQPEPQDHATLVLELLVPEGEPLHAIQVQLVKGGDELDPKSRHKVELEDGLFVVSHIEPGRYLVRVEPLDIGHFIYCASYCHVPSFEVELAPREMLRRTLQVEVGGRIRVGVQGWEGEERYADITLLDAAGRPFSIRSVTRWQDGRDTETYARPDGAVSLTKPTELYPSLPPGRYELRLDSQDLYAAPIAIDVEAGRTAEATFVVSAK